MAKTSRQKQWRSERTIEAAPEGSVETSGKVKPLGREIFSGPGGDSIRVLLGRARTCYWDLEDTPRIRSAFFNLNTPKDFSVHLDASGR